MSGVTVAFLLIGGLGVAVLAVSLIFGEILHLAHLHGGADGPFSTPVLGGGLGAFGFGGAVAAALIPGPELVKAMVAVPAGVAAAVPTGWFVVRLVRAAMNMRTDATPRRDDLVGTTGVVVTPIPATGYGEVRITLGGQPVKLYARAGQPLPLGTRVLVINAPTDTSVLVEENTLPDLSSVE